MKYFSVFYSCNLLLSLIFCINAKVDIPIIFNTKEHCLQEITITNLNKDYCCSKIWHRMENIQLTNGVDVSSYKTNSSDSKSIKNSLKKCLETKECVGLTIGGGEAFVIHNNNYNVSVKEKRGLTSYAMKCCKPKMFEISDNEQHNLPIIFDGKTNCINQFKCEFKSWQIKENVNYINISLLQSIVKKSTLDCLNECINYNMKNKTNKNKKTRCKYLAVEENAEVWKENFCHFYSNNKNDDDEVGEGINKTSGNNTNDIVKQMIINSNNKKIIFYEMICCKVYEKSLWNEKNNDLMMLYQPLKVCKTISTTNVKSPSCLTKIWQIEDGVRMIGENWTTYLYDLQSCLNGCVKADECIGVSVNFAEHICWYFREEEFTRHELYLKWTSYTLKCCDEILETSLNYPDYQIVFNATESCLAESINNQNCSQKVWHYQKDIRFGGNEINRKSLTIKACLQFCIETVNCVGVSMEIINSADFDDDDDDTRVCQLHDNNYQPQPDKNWKSYLLQCCEFVSKPLPQEGKFKNIPIVHERSKDFCGDIFLHNDSYRAWHIIESVQPHSEQYIIKSIENINTIDCLNECTNDEYCLMAVMQNKDIYERVCHLMNRPYFIDADNRSTAFRLIKCKLRDELISENVTSDLVILYQPQKTCRNLTITNINHCPMKLWHAEDDIKIKEKWTSFQNFNGTLNCLNECSNNPNCGAVSIDYNELQCFFFDQKDIQLSKEMGHPQWVSYTLNCCNEKIKDSYK